MTYLENITQDSFIVAILVHIKHFMCVFEKSETNKIHLRNWLHIRNPEIRSFISVCAAGRDTKQVALAFL